MRFHPPNGPEILASKSEIPAKNPKSEILPKSEICLLSCNYSALRVSLRISDASFRNPGEILNNHVISMACSGFQDFGKAPLKGWVDSPARREVHHPPLGILHGPKFWPALSPTTAAGTAKHQPPSSSTPSSPPEKETTHG
jgi:hypothetical protein